VDALAGELAASGLAARGEVLLVDDDVASEIAAHARAIDASHVVIGSHGKTSLLDALVGTVTKGVLERAKVPVVVVPRRR
jgi:nucleotide-binding universal stress UspA family protein